jgi:aminomethyltransferase
VDAAAGASQVNGPAPAALRRTALHGAHVDLGAKMVGFGGWEMPLSYPAGTVAEHRACRTGAVAFDVSHLGTVQVHGPGAFERLQRTLTNDLSRIGPGRAQYTHLLDDDGSVADDIIVWWVDDERFDVMPNASNTSRVLDALGGTDTTATRAVIAVQGPQARHRLAAVVPEAAAIGRFCVGAYEWGGERCLVAGTGYTGEDGVECAVPSSLAEGFWSAVVAAGAVPAGLGARDTLRLEAGLPLHGHELGPGITPLQAGLGWVVGWKKGEFRGRDALERERADGPRRLLHGLVADGRQPPRDGSPVLAGGVDIGTVTSGNFSPMLERGIALAFLDTGVDAAEGDRVTAVVRGRDLAVTVAPTRAWPPATPPVPARGRTE